MANQRLAHDDIDIDSHFLDITPLHDGGEGAVVELGFCSTATIQKCLGLVLSHDRRQTSPESNLMQYSIGFIGYGVPLNGMRNDSLLKLVKDHPNYDMIRHICTGNDQASPYLASLATRFRLCNQDIDTHYFFETELSADVIVMQINGDPPCCTEADLRQDPKGPAQRRVDCPRKIGEYRCYWVPRTHSGLAKVASRDDDVYRMTVDVLKLIMEGHLGT
ncbi:hypothetical protein PG996_003009 [Apiospora saccharicola]|uniref:Uncharacterized protein n=1 Tax=Apiospora saccharicola TaxID=335842 RepID=A0ABR1W012_9PEZI